MCVQPIKSVRVLHVRPPTRAAHDRRNATPSCVVPHAARELVDGQLDDPLAIQLAEVALQDGEGTAAFSLCIALGFHYIAYQACIRRVSDMYRDFR